MTVVDLMQGVIGEDPREIRDLTRGCRACRRFVRRLRRTPEVRLGWDDVPEPLIERISARLRERLYEHLDGILVASCGVQGGSGSVSS